MRVHFINKVRAAAAMPEEAPFVANVRSNVRELGRCAAQDPGLQPLQTRRTFIQLAREEKLKDLLSIQNRQISVENTQKTVADYYKIKVADMCTWKRLASIALAAADRHVPGLAKELTQKSSTETGEFLRRARPHHGAVMRCARSPRSASSSSNSTSSCMCWSRRQGLRCSGVPAAPGAA